MAAPDLKQRTARGVLKAVSGQAASLVLRTLSMVVMARLVTPEDFGLVGMVTALLGLLALFRDAGLPMATVQRRSLTPELLSTLFWANFALGCGLTLLTIAAAPLVVQFYAEPRLGWITVALAANFLVNGAGAQHRALLQRQMRFGLLAASDLASVAASVAIGICMGVAGMGYWSLVGMALAQPLVAASAAWIGARWIPGRPRRVEGLTAMFRYGGLATFSSAVAYLSYNLDKVLLGRFFGPEVLGHYGRAFQLVSLPGDTLYGAYGSVLFPALSRLQSERERQRSYFLRGYGLFVTAVAPIAVAFGAFAEDIVRVFLGSQWMDAVPVFRALAPTVMAFGLLNPMKDLLLANNLNWRILLMAAATAPVLVTAYAIGLTHGAVGVATAFSCALLLLVVPLLCWATHGTPVSLSDLAEASWPPTASAVLGGIVSWLVSQLLGDVQVVARLVISMTVLFAIYGAVLAAQPGQRRALGEALSGAVGSRRRE